MELKCPICSRVFVRAEEGAGDYFPFCCERCKLIDMGAWLSDEYGIGVDDRAESEDEGGEG